MVRLVFREWFLFFGQNTGDFRKGLKHNAETRRSQV
jgi:hypothetical protein